MGLEEGVLNTFLVVEARCDPPWWQGDLGGRTQHSQGSLFTHGIQAFLLVFYMAAEWEAKGLAEA